MVELVKANYSKGKKYFNDLFNNQEEQTKKLLLSLKEGNREKGRENRNGHGPGNSKPDAFYDAAYDRDYFFKVPLRFVSLLGDYHRFLRRSTVVRHRPRRAEVLLVSRQKQTPPIEFLKIEILEFLELDNLEFLNS